MNSIYMTEIVSKLTKVVKLPARLGERIEIECTDESKFQVINGI
jgi:hypothetical protein